MTEVESDGSVATADPTIAGVAKAHVVKRSKQRSLPIRFIRSQPLGALALFMILLFVSVAILAPIISPYDPVAQDRRAILTAPGPGHLLGTDVIGRDIFSRILYGARTSLLVSVATVTIGMSIGVSIGIASCSAEQAKARTAEQLINAADQAMYEAKANGRGRYVILPISEPSQEP